ARSASFTARSTDRRKAPGMAPSAARRFSPSMMKVGQIRSSTVRRFSCTSRRDQSALRMRLSRRDPVISSTFRAPAALAGVNLVMTNSNWRAFTTMVRRDQCDKLVPAAIAQTVPVLTSACRALSTFVPVDPGGTQFDGFWRRRRYSFRTQRAGGDCHAVTPEVAQCADKAHGAGPGNGPGGLGG